MRLSIGLLVVVLAGCATLPEETPPGVETPPAQTGGPQALAYGTPQTPTLTYEFSDTAVSDIQAGAAGAIRVSTGVKGSAELKFEQNGDDQKVTVAFPQFAGTFSNSAGGNVTASVADIKGQAVLTLSPKGVFTIRQKPEVTPAFRQVEPSDNPFRRFFARLPGRNVRQGATWTDTISSTDTEDGMTRRASNIIRATYTRDSVVDGRTVAVITAQSERTLDSTGTSQGVELVQKLKGTSTSVILWDLERRAVIARTENSQYSGTMDLPAMGMTRMPMTVSGRSVLRLRR